MRMPRPPARGALVGVAIGRPPHVSRPVALAAPLLLALFASVAMLGVPAEDSWGTPFSWSTPDRPNIDIGVRPMGLDTNLAGLNSLLCGVVVTCDAAAHLGVGLHVLHSVQIHDTEIA